MPCAGEEASTASTYSGSCTRVSCSRVASGASWVSFHHGGGVGIGNSLHAGQVIVADGTPEMRVRLERVLTNDPGIGVARHADAGYREARETARRTGIRLPMDEG